MASDENHRTEAERLAFESWMRNNDLAINAAWNGVTYVGAGEQLGSACVLASQTRQLWAMWRHRASIAHLPSAIASRAIDVSQRLQDAESFAVDDAVPPVAEEAAMLLDTIARAAAARIPLDDRLSWEEIQDALRQAGPHKNTPMKRGCP